MGDSIAMTELRRVEPHRMRERIVEFFWRIRIWPYATKEEYYRFWDWRYGALSEVEPAAWIALEGDTVIAHIAVNFRDLYLNGQRLRAGILANFRIDESYRSGALAAALVGAPRAAVRRGEFDLITGYGTSSAHQVALALGYRDLGPMRSFVRVLRWGPILRRRYPKLLPVIPLIGAAARLHQATRRVAEVPSSLIARALPATEVRALDPSHWRATASMSWSGNVAFYANRFCSSEFSTGRMFAVEDVRSHAFEAIAAATGSARLTILQCDTNQHAMSRPQAVEAILRTDPDVESVHIPMLPQTDLAKEFVANGYRPLPARFENPWIRDRSWSAWWRADHPLAAELSRTHRWPLWSGWTHH